MIYSEDFTCILVQDRLLYLRVTEIYTSTDLEECSSRMHFKALQEFLEGTYEQ